MNRLNNIKAVIFDADGTLVDHKECEKEALQSVFAGIGIEFKPEYQDVFRPLDRALWSAAIKGTSEIPKEEIPTYRFKKFFDLVGIDCTDYVTANKNFRRGLAGANAVLADAPDIVQYLHDKGYKLAVATNGVTVLQKPRVANSKVGKYISEIVVSEEIGYSKPGPQIFFEIMERLGVKPDETIMVGDQLDKDVKGAQNAGIKGVWFNPNKSKNETNVVPDHEIGSLLELKDIL